MADTFLSDAGSILGTAESAAGGTDYTLLIGGDGGLTMLAESDWPLERLAAERCARRAYRVSHGASGVTVDGVEGGRRLRMGSEPMRAVARRLLSAPALYLLAASERTSCPRSD